MRRLGLVILLVSFGCGDPKSPVQPTLSAPAPVPRSPLEFSVSGSVADTVSRRLADARVEVIDGPRGGTATMTNEAGRLWLPGSFTGTVALK
jgi:hypothetical protein